MTATFRLRPSELDEAFLEKLRYLFGEKEVEIIVYESREMDETEYLLHDPENARQLLEAVDRVERREGLIPVDIDSLK